MSLYSSNAPAAGAILRGPAWSDQHHAIGTGMNVGTEKDVAYDVNHPILLWNLSDIPSGSRIESAQLEMYLAAVDIDTTHYVQVWRLVRDGIDWSDCSWAEYDESADLDWGIQGANASTDRDTLLGQLQFSSGSSAGKYTFNLTASEIEKYFWGQKVNRGLLIKADIEDWNVVGVSRGTLTTWRGTTYATAEMRPTLKITYHAGVSYWIMGCGFGGLGFAPGKFLLKGA